MEVKIVILARRGMCDGPKFSRNNGGCEYVIGAITACRNRRQKSEIYRKSATLIRPLGLDNIVLRGGCPEEIPNRKTWKIHHAYSPSNCWWRLGWILKKCYANCNFLHLSAEKYRPIAFVSTEQYGCVRVIVARLNRSSLRVTFSSFTTALFEETVGQKPG